MAVSPVQRKQPQPPRPVEKPPEAAGQKRAAERAEAPKQAPRAAVELQQDRYEGKDAATEQAARRQALGTEAPGPVEAARADLRAAQAEAGAGVRAASRTARANVEAAEERAKADLAAAEARARAELAALGRPERREVRAVVNETMENVEATRVSSSSELRRATRDARSTVDAAWETATSGLNHASQAATEALDRAEAETGTRLDENKAAARAELRDARREARAALRAANETGAAESLHARAPGALHDVEAAGAAAATELGQAGTSAAEALRAADAAARHELRQTNAGTVSALRATGNQAVDQLQGDNRRALHDFRQAGTEAIGAVTEAGAEGGAQIRGALRDARGDLEQRAAQIEADLDAARAQAAADLRTARADARQQLRAARVEAREDVQRALSEAQASLAGDPAALEQLEAIGERVMGRVGQVNARASEHFNAQVVDSNDDFRAANQHARVLGDRLGERATAKAERVTEQLDALATGGLREVRQQTNLTEQRLTSRFDADRATFRSQARAHDEIASLTARQNVRAAKIEADADLRAARIDSRQDARAVELRSGTDVEKLQIRSGADHDQLAAELRGMSRSARVEATAEEKKLRPGADPAAIDRATRRELRQIALETDGAKERIGLRADQQAAAADIGLRDALASARIDGRQRTQGVRTGAEYDRALSDLDLQAGIARAQTRAFGATQRAEVKEQAALSKLRPGANDRKIDRDAAAALESINQGTQDAMRTIRRETSFGREEAAIRRDEDLASARVTARTAHQVQDVATEQALRANRLEGKAARDAVTVRTQAEVAKLAPGADDAAIAAQARRDVRSLERAADRGITRGDVAAQEEISGIRQQSRQRLRGIAEGADRDVFEARFDNELLSERELAELRVRESDRIKGVVSGITEDMDEQHSVSGKATARYARDLERLSGELLTPALRRGVDALHDRFEGQNHLSSRNLRDIGEAITRLERRTGMDMDRDQRIAGFSREYIDAAIAEGRKNDFAGWTGGALSFAGAVSDASSLPHHQRPGAIDVDRQINAHGMKIGAVPESATDGMIIGGDGRLYDPSTPLDDVPKFEPQRGAVTQDNAIDIHTNGIMTDARAHFDALQDLANRKGEEVVGLHNATHGFVSDIAESAMGKLGFDTKPAQGLATVVEGERARGRTVDLHGHSQGAIETSSALENVRDDLIAGGMTPAEAERAMADITVDLYGGAATNFPVGPSYTVHENRLDPVSELFGPTSRSAAPHGANMTFDRFTDFEMNPHAFTNYLDEIYGPATPGRSGLGDFAGRTFGDLTVGGAFDREPGELDPFGADGLRDSGGSFGGRDVGGGLVTGGYFDDHGRDGSGGSFDPFGSDHDSGGSYAGRDLGGGLIGGGALDDVGHDFGLGSDFGLSSDFGGHDSSGGGSDFGGGSSFGGSDSGFGGLGGLY